MAKPARKEEPVYYKALIVNIGEHYFAAPIDNIQDVILRSPTTKVPLASKHIIGLLNLRGHVVTEINVAYTLGIEDDSELDDTNGYSIVINHGNEMFSMVFEGVGDVIDINTDDIEQLPDTSNKDWLSMTRGIFRTQERLIVILDFERLLAALNPQHETSDE
jgi:purine-binding chemotaxis protein CheW